MFLGETVTSVPFVTVASDGSGDYTSIKTAIEAQAQVGVTAGTAPIVIWVKRGTYNDTSSATVDITNRNVVVIAGMGAGMPRQTGYPLQQWTIGGFRVTGAVSGQVVLYGLRMVTTTTFIDGTSTASTPFVGLYGCEISQTGAVTICGNTCSPSVWGSDSDLVGTLHSTAPRLTLALDRCTIDLGSGVTASSAFSPSIRLTNCYITRAASYSYTCSTAGTGDYILRGCGMPTGSSFSITITGVGQVEVIDCDQDESVGSASTLTISGQGTNASRTNAILAGNTLAFTNLTVTGAASTNGDAYIDGVYRTLTIGLDNTQANVKLRATAAVAAGYLVINNTAVGCQVNLNIHAQTTGSQAWTVNDNKHVISCSNYSQANLTVASVPAPPAVPGSGVGGSATCWFTVT